MVPSKDRQGGEEACLYGEEYYALEDAVVGILMAEFGGKAEDRAALETMRDAKAACEKMRQRMAEAPEGLAGRV
jgi:hypothetical protein